MISRMLQIRDRRSFLKACGILGLGAAGGGYLQAAYEVVKIRSDLLKVSQTRLAMGTYVTMTAMHPSRDHAEEAIGRAFEEMDRLIEIFNRHDDTTPVSVLNQEGVLSEPPPELVMLLHRAAHFHRISSGAFDVTVKPLLDLFKASQDSLPAQDDIRRQLDLVNAEQIEVTPKRIHFFRSGMGITLDGIAKGYIVDRASQVLAYMGIERHLINAGGDIRTRGVQDENRPWTIAIQDPGKQDKYPDVLRLTTGAVATSGNYEVYYDKDRVYHHLIDPHTGQSPHQHTSVSVTADSVMAADALSTAVFVLDHADGLRLIDGLERSACLILDEQGRMMRSRRWNRSPLLTYPVNSSYMRSVTEMTDTGQHLTG